MQNLQAVLNWCGAFVNFQPFTIGGSEPALSNANVVLQTILGPPFAWRWNRAELVFDIDETAQDYIKSAPDFGFIEKAWVTQNGGEQKEIEIASVLAGAKEQGRPHTIAVQSEDTDSGAVLFRLLPGPDGPGTVTVIYQKKAKLMSSVASSWAPIPDDYAYIYQWGFLSLSSILANDPRFPIYNQKFISHLLGAQEGIDELQRNIFLGSWLEITKQAERATQKTAQGIAARQR